MALLSRIPRKLNIQTDMPELVNLKDVNAILEGVARSPGDNAADFSLHIQVSWKGDLATDAELSRIRALRTQAD